MRKVVICGGHLTPALALIEKLQSTENQIYFFGRKYATEGVKKESQEYKIISKLGIKFFSITTGRLQRRFTTHTIPSLLKLPVGVVQSLYFLIIVRPQVVVSFGSYLSLPVVFCAWLLGIPSVVHEQSSTAGLANKINAIFAEKVFLAWKSSEVHFPKEKTKVIGNLTRSAVAKKTTTNKSLKDFFNKQTIYVTGGNQGSHFINNLIYESYKDLNSYNIYHQVGSTNYQDDLGRASKIKSPNYKFTEFVGDDEIGFVISNAKLIVSRSGANTVWELATSAKPAILIPLPYASHDEQFKNAQILSSNKSAIMLTQKEANKSSLKQAINNIANNYAKYESNAQKLQKSLPPNAATFLAEAVLGYT